MAKEKQLTETEQKRAEYEHYLELVGIDRSNLHEEFTHQPQNYAEISEGCTIADFEKQSLKEQVKVIEAEVDLEIRNGTYENLPAKVTENAIKSIVAVDARVQEVNKAHIQAIFFSNMLEGARVASEHKKKSLEKLTDLHMTGYFSAPKETSTQSREVGADRQREALNDSRKQRTLGKEN